MADLLGNLRAPLIFFALALFCHAGRLPAQSSAGRQTDVAAPRPTLAVDIGVHIGTVNDIASNDEGGLVATASTDKTVRIWDAADGTLRRTFRPTTGTGDIGMMYAVAFQPKTTLLAAGGYTGQQDGWPIYLLDVHDGRLVSRLTGMPNATTRLAFSSDGRFLAAGSGGIIRVFDRDLGWKPIQTDTVQGTVYGLQFAQDGRLVAVTDAGMIRLYAPDHHVRATRQGKQLRISPILALSPDGTTIAVAHLFDDGVVLLDGASLADQDLDVHLSGGGARTLSWSPDGARLFVGYGLSVSLMGDRIYACLDHGRGDCDDYNLGPLGNSLTAMATLPDGRLALGGGARPFVAVQGGPLKYSWYKQASTTNTHTLLPLIALSPTGDRVEFRFEASNQVLAFEPGKPQALSLTKTEVPSVAGINLLSGLGPDVSHPIFNGRFLDIEPNEQVLSRYISPDNSRLILGTTNEIYAYASDGTLIWRRFTPEQVTSVLVSEDGKLLVAAIGDGTVRWYDAQTGRLLCSSLVFTAPAKLKRFAPLDINSVSWVVWTPDGYYNASDTAHDSLQWWVSGAPGDLTTAIPVSSLQGFLRPGLFGPLLRSRDVIVALGVSEQRASQQVLQAAFGAASVAPGARLHVLAIGIKDYGTAAKGLHLDFADKDAHDLADALMRHQKLAGSEHTGLYVDVVPTYLPNGLATAKAIDDAFDDVATLMRAGGGQDVAVVIFSGHGFLLGDDFYLIPAGADASSARNLEASAIPIDRFRKWIGRLAANGQVIVLLDACHSGAAASDGSKLSVDANALRDAAPDKTTIVLTSSQGIEVSAENPKWQHGAFTKALLELLDPVPAAPMTPTNMANLADQVDARLALLTKNKQHMGKQIPGAAALRPLLVAVP